MTDKIQMIMVCLSKGVTCDTDGCIIESGDNTYLFCCSKGFESALEAYTGKKINDPSSNIQVTEPKLY